MKKYNRKYVSYQIYTKQLCEQIGTPWDFKNNAVYCMKFPEKCLASQRFIDLIKDGKCVIRKVTQEWRED